MEIGFWERVVGLGFIVVLVGCIVVFHMLTGRSKARKAAAGAKETPTAAGEPAAPSSHPPKGSKV